MKSPESFRWRVRLSDSAPEKRFGVVAVAVLSCAIGWFVFQSPLMGLIGFAIILGSTAEYWLGTDFVVDEAGASARTALSLTAINWSDVKRLVWDTNGVRISPLERPGTLDPFRGVYLRFSDNNKEDIERAIAKFSGIHRSLGGGFTGRGDGSVDPESGGGNLSPEPSDARDPDARNE